MTDLDALALDKLQDAYWSVQSGDDPYVRLADVVAASGMSRDEVTSAVRHASRTRPDIGLDPAPYPGLVTDAMRDAAVKLGGENVHYLSMDVSKRPPERQTMSAAEPPQPARSPIAAVVDAMATMTEESRAKREADAAGPKPATAKPTTARPATAKPATATTSTSKPTTTSRGTKMPTSATAQSAAGKKPIITFPKPTVGEINGNVSSAAYCNDAKFQFHQLATYAEAMHAALVNDMTEFLQANGLDGQKSIGPLSYGSDARSAARKAAKAMKNIAAEAENLARQFGMLKRDLDRYVWDPVQQAQAQAEQNKRSAPIRIGA